MAEIVLARIDSRQLHGQVVTKWIPQSEAKKVVLINDELVNDEFMKMIYLNAAPNGVKVEIVTAEEAGKKYLENQFGTGKVLVLIPNLKMLEKAYTAGLRLEKLQVGGLGGAPNRKVVFGNITLDDYDVEVLKKVENLGTEIYFQIIPEDVPRKFSEILKKY